MLTQEGGRAAGVTQSAVTDDYSNWKGRDGKQDIVDLAVSVISSTQGSYFLIF